MNKTMAKVGTEGLYLKPSSKTYYAQYRLHGTQHWKSLKTKVLTQARVRLREKMVEVEKARLRASPSADLLAMGDCETILFFTECSLVRTFRHAEDHVSTERTPRN